jgi:hypothetical protein
MLEVTTNTLTDCIGYAASILVLATFCFSNPLWLRLFALQSNIAFIIFGYFASIEPVMLLHILLAPVNAFYLIRLRLAARDDHGLAGRADASCSISGSGSLCSVASNARSRL